MKFQVIIIGGGCAGAATAISLLQQGVEHVAILERSNFSQTRVGETIQPPTAQLIMALEAWEDFTAVGHLDALGSASVWGTDTVSYKDFMNSTHGRGWHLERNAFDKMLLGIAERKGVTVFRTTAFLSSQRENSQWQLSCLRHTGETLTLESDFVVDATGRAISFAKRQGAEKVLFDDLHSVYSYWQQPENDRERFDSTYTLVEAVPDGWWYSALLPNHQIVVAFMTDKTILKDEQLKDRDSFMTQLQLATHTAKRMQHCQMSHAPKVAVANSYVLDEITGDGWLAVGDSASAYDPLSSYGIHKALDAGLKAGTTIASHLKGDTDSLTVYSQEVVSEFEDFIPMRSSYYQMEKRWENHPFWKSRQTWAGIHPMAKLKAADEPTGTRRINRILPDRKLKELCELCTTTQKAHELVQAFQTQTQAQYPDWRVIKAVSYLQQHNMLQQIS